MALRDRRTKSDAEVITLSSGVSVRLFRPVGITEPTPALLWIHGGGYVIGSARQDDPLCHRFSRRLGITVASVEYRLALIGRDRRNRADELAGGWVERLEGGRGGACFGGGHTADSKRGLG